jgi:hypothetical protein
MSDWIQQHRAEIEAFGPIPGVTPECVVVGCTRSPFSRGLCKSHYKRARRTFDPGYSETRGSKQETHP